MSTTFLRPAAACSIDGIEYAIREGSSVKLDSGAVPYAVGSIELPLLDDDTLTWLDPREDDIRVPIAATWSGVDRTFDLGLRVRKVDHVSKTVTLDLASDEALMQDYAPLVEDSGARAHETSARAVCDYVLDKIGASLEPGTDDADVTAYFPVTQLLPNPSFEIDTSNWVEGFNATSLTREALTTPAAIQGGYGGRWVAGAGQSNLHPGPNATTFSVTPGKWYVWSFYIYSGAALTSRAVLQWYASNGAVFVGETLGALISTSTSAFTRAYVIAQAPAGATHMWPYAGTYGNAPGTAHIVDGGMLHEGTELVDYFDGATPDDADYTYEWTGDVDNSPSTREPTIERLPEVFVWKPGVSAWDFITSIITSVGLVLWCDELRQWWLSLPANRTIVTLVNVDANTASQGDDTLSREDVETYVTGVAVRYRWRDADGIDREQYDTAGTPGKVLLVELDGAYPGPGAAAAILTRRQGSGRRQTVTAIVPLTTTPGMTAQIRLPGAPDTVGRLAAIDFDLATGLAGIEAAGLVDLMPGSIDALEGTIDGLVGTIDSL